MAGCTSPLRRMPPLRSPVIERLHPWCKAVSDAIAEPSDEARISPHLPAKDVQDRLMATLLSWTHERENHKGENHDITCSFRWTRPGRGFDCRACRIRGGRQMGAP